MPGAPWHSFMFLNPYHLGPHRPVADRLVTGNYEIQVALGCSSYSFDCVDICCYYSRQGAGNSPNGQIPAALKL
jgi:hypothetical protein